MTKKKELPKYYKGAYQGIHAYHVINDYDLTYNIGTAVTYLLRAGKKPNNPAEQDIKKAIDHLNFELERLQLVSENEQMKRINKNYFNENTSSTHKCCKAKS